MRAIEPLTTQQGADLTWLQHASASRTIDNLYFALNRRSEPCPADAYYEGQTGQPIAAAVGRHLAAAA